MLLGFLFGWMRCVFNALWITNLLSLLGGTVGALWVRQALGRWLGGGGTSFNLFNLNLGGCSRKQAGQGGHTTT